MAGRVAAGQQAQNGPGGLRGVLAAAVNVSVVVAGAAFAPAAVGVLDGAEPFAGAQDAASRSLYAGGAQAAQREEGAVDVVDAPAAVPAAVRLLGPQQVLDAALDGRVVSERRRTQTGLRAPGR